MASDSAPVTTATEVGPFSSEANGTDPDTTPTEVVPYSSGVNVSTPEVAPSSSGSNATPPEVNVNTDVEVPAPDERSDDGVDDERIFGQFPMHVEFVKLIRAAKKKADDTKEKTPISWRGYHSSIYPNLPDFTEKDLWNKLAKALQGVFNMSAPERKV